MRERVGELVGGIERRMWVMTFHSACARLLRIEAERLGYTKSFTIYDEADSPADAEALPRRARGRHQALPAARGPRPHLRRQERPDRRRGLPGAGRRRSLRGHGRPGLPPLRAPDARRQRDGLRRPADADGERAGAVRRRPRPLPRPLPLGPGRRVPGHQPRAVPAAAAAGGPGREPDGGRRRLPGDLRLPRGRLPQHPRVRGALPRGRGGEARAELPLDPDDPLGGERADLPQPHEPREEPLDRRGGGREDRRRRARRRARRGPLRRRRDRGAGRRRARSSATRSRSSTGPTRTAGCWRTSSSATSCPTR